MILPTDEDIDIIKTHFRGRDVAYNETKSYIDKERKQLSYIPKDVRDEYKIFPSTMVIMNIQLQIYQMIHILCGMIVNLII